MTKQEIVAVLIADGEWREKPLTENPAFEPFVAIMKRHQYGPSTLRAAWAWFQVGWHAAP